jgi:hypothetical protein
LQVAGSSLYAVAPWFSICLGGSQIGLLIHHRPYDQTIFLQLKQMPCFAVVSGLTRIQWVGMSAFTLPENAMDILV